MGGKLTVPFPILFLVLSPIPSFRSAFARSPRFPFTGIFLLDQGFSATCPGSVVVLFRPLTLLFLLVTLLVPVHTDTLPLVCQRVPPLLCSG